MHESGAPDDPAHDCYRIAEDGEEVELRVKASRFFGQVFAVTSEVQAAERLDAIRKLYHDASHHCWALRCGPPGAIVERSDDDGEPAGTAGVPILHPLRASGVHDALVVVTRWFGGTLLGKGGLVQSYGECARLALDASRSRVRWREVEIEVQVDYDDLGAIEALLAREAQVVRAIERDFASTPRFVVRVRRSAGVSIARQIIDATAGRARVLSHPA